MYKEKKPSESVDHVSKGMEEIYLYTEGNNDCQFSMDELMAAVTGEKLNWRTIQAKLLEKYEDRTIVKPGLNQFDVPIICFTDTGYKVLIDSWYDQEKGKNDVDEWMRIVKKAVQLSLDRTCREKYTILVRNHLGMNFFKTLIVFPQPSKIPRRGDDADHQNSWGNE